jgi:hypothetical protein
MVLLRKQITYRNKPYEVRWEEEHYHYIDGYGEKYISLILYEITEKKTLWFNYKDYKEVYKIDVTNYYNDYDYIKQINKLFEAYEIILCKNKDKENRLEELEQWDGVIKGGTYAST